MPLKFVSQFSSNWPWPSSKVTRVRKTRTFAPSISQTFSVNLEGIWYTILVLWNLYTFYLVRLRFTGENHAYVISLKTRQNKTNKQQIENSNSKQIQNNKQTNSFNFGSNTDISRLISSQFDGMLETTKLCLPQLYALFVPIFWQVF